MLLKLIDLLPAPDLAPRARLLYETREEARTALARSKIPVNVPSLDLATPVDMTRIVRLEGSGLQISMEDCWAIVGVRGSGKTTAAEKLGSAYHLLFPQAIRYTLDSKPDPSFDDLPAVWHEGNTLPPLGEPGQRIIWRPHDNHVDMYDAWFGQLLASPVPMIIEIDELSSIGGATGQSFPVNHARLLKQGRSKHKVMLNLTQEAAYIPRNVLGQCNHLLRLRLNLESDAARLDKQMHGTARPRREPTTPFGLWYRRLDVPGAGKFFSDWQTLLS